MCVLRLGGLDYSLVSLGGLSLYQAPDPPIYLPL